MKNEGLRIRRFGDMVALCDGKPPAGIAPESGELYMGNVIAWFKTFDEAKKARSLIDSLYGFNRNESEKGQKIPIFEFHFFYRLDPENPGYKEYNGAIFTAPDEKTAWNIFLSCDGEFKCPASENYDIYLRG